MNHTATSTPFELIGRSEEGSPLPVYFVGGGDAPLRVLIVTGQHGDEPEARLAVEEYLQSVRRHDSGAGHVQLAVLPNLNPDGARRKSRFNAGGIDLNRDHQLLQSAETRALHRFVRGWRPHLVVDVHTYPPRRRVLLQRGLVYCHDVFLDLPTNPAALHQTGGAWSASRTRGQGSGVRRQGAGVRGQGSGVSKDDSPFTTHDFPIRFLQPILRDLRALGYRCGRYVLFRKSGRVRHSTPDVTDARNSLALRSGCLTVLLEGRQPLPGESASGRQRVRAAMVAGLDRIVRFFSDGWPGQSGACPGPADAGASLRSSPGQPTASEIPIHCRYGPGERLQMEFRDAQSGEVRVVEFDSRSRLPSGTFPRSAGRRIRSRPADGTYTPTIEVTRCVDLPAAYAVPRTATTLLEVLKRHGFAGWASPTNAQSPMPNVQCPMSNAPAPGHREIGHWTLGIGHSPTRGAVPTLPRVAGVEQYRILTARPSARPRRPPHNLSVTATRRRMSLDDYVLFPVDADNGASLAVHLEPESKYALHRHPELDLPIIPGQDYPILRVPA